MCCAYLLIAIRIVICDECHKLKDPGSNQSKAGLPLLYDAAHCILISGTYGCVATEITASTGTPSINRPHELFTQLAAIRPDIFKSQSRTFAYRYCNGIQMTAHSPQRRQHHIGGVSVSGHSNLQELNIVLREAGMIRREKSEVLDQLQEKWRKKVRALRSPQLTFIVPGGGGHSNRKLHPNSRHVQEV